MEPPDQYRAPHQQMNLAHASRRLTSADDAATRLAASLIECPVIARSEDAALPDLATIRRAAMHARLALGSGVDVIVVVGDGSLLVVVNGEGGFIADVDLDSIAVAAVGALLTVSQGERAKGMRYDVRCLGSPSRQTSDTEGTLWGCGRTETAPHC